MLDRDIHAQTFAQRVRVARALWDAFYVCPTTGHIIEALSGDDKVLCRCGHSNPRCPSERTEQTGTHLRRFLQETTAEAFVRSRDNP